MRLINADGVKNSLLTDLLTGVDGGADASYLKTYEVIDRIEKIVNEWVDKEPTVKAIPIEWIEKKAQEFLINRNFRWATDFQEVVDMWKLENNIPLFDGELKITLGKENGADK